MVSWKLQLVAHLHLSLILDSVCNMISRIRQIHRNSIKEFHEAYRQLYDYQSWKISRYINRKLFLRNIFTLVSVPKKGRSSFSGGMEYIPPKVLFDLMPPNGGRCKWLNIWWERVGDSFCYVPLRMIWWKATNVFSRRLKFYEGKFYMTIMELWKVISAGSCQRRYLAYHALENFDTALEAASPPHATTASQWWCAYRDIPWPLFCPEKKLSEFF